MQWCKKHLVYIQKKNAILLAYLAKMFRHIIREMSKDNDWQIRLQAPAGSKLIQLPDYGIEAPDSAPAGLFAPGSSRLLCSRLHLAYFLETPIWSFDPCYLPKVSGSLLLNSDSMLQALAGCFTSSFIRLLCPRLQQIPFLQAPVGSSCSPVAESALKLLLMNIIWGMSQVNNVRDYGKSCIAWTLI